MKISATIKNALNSKFILCYNQRPFKSISITPKDNGISKTCVFNHLIPSGLTKKYRMKTFNQICFGFFAKSLRPCAFAVKILNRQDTKTQRNRKVRR